MSSGLAGSSGRVTPHTLQEAPFQFFGLSDDEDQVLIHGGAASQQPPQAVDLPRVQVKPAAQAAHPGAPVALDDYRQSIEDNLAGPLVDRQLDDWLKEARQRTDIVYHEEAFQ